MQSGKAGITTKPDATQIATLRNRKSGSNVAADSDDANSPSWAGRWSNLAADHAKRWEKRLYVAKSGGVELACVSNTWASGRNSGSTPPTASPPPRKPSASSPS